MYEYKSSQVIETIKVSNRKAGVEIFKRQQTKRPTTGSSH